MVVSQWKGDGGDGMVLVWTVGEWTTDGKNGMEMEGMV